MGGRVRVGLRLPLFERVDHAAEVAAQAEQRGFDCVWVPDSQLLWRDAFVGAWEILRRTERVDVGIGVTNTVVRHPSVVASAVRTLAEAGPDRLVLGVGTGFSSVRPVGLAPRPVAAFERDLEDLRALLGGEAVRRSDGGAYELEDAGFRVPMLAAASGPRASEVACRRADGLIYLGVGTRKDVSAHLEQVRAATAQRPGFRVVLIRYAYVTEDPERDIRLLKPVVAGMAQVGGNAALERFGIRLRTVPAPATFDFIHCRDYERSVRAADAVVDDADAWRFADEACLFGRPDDIRRALTDWRAVGVDEVFLQGLGSFRYPTTLLESFPLD